MHVANILHFEYVHEIMKSRVRCYCLVFTHNRRAAGFYMVSGLEWLY